MRSTEAPFPKSPRPTTREGPRASRPRRPPSEWPNQHIDTAAELKEIGEQIEAEGKLASERTTGTASLPGFVSAPNEKEADRDLDRERKDRDKPVEKPPKSRELPKVWKQDAEDDSPSFRSCDPDTVPKSTDRSLNVMSALKESAAGSGSRRKPIKMIDALMGMQAYASTDRGGIEFDFAADDRFVSATPKTFQSNSFNTPETDPADNPDEADPRQQGSSRGGARVLNAAKYIFNRDRETKSRSNHQKTSRSANTKLGPGPAIASVKKFLQGSFSKPTPQVSSTTAAKSFDDGPTVKTLPFASPGDLRQSGDQSGAFKKPTKDLLFNRSGRTVGNSSGLGQHYSPPDERVG